MSLPQETLGDRVTLPLLPLRDVVVYPHIVIPLFVGRPKSIKALEVAMEAGKHILLVAQKSASKDEPTTDDLYHVGSVASILQMLKLPDGTVKVLVEGNQRAKISDFVDAKTHFAANAEITLIEPPTDHETLALMRSVFTEFDQYVKLNKKIPPEILTSLASIDDAGRLADTIAAHLPIKLEQKQEILEMFSVHERLEHLFGLLNAEIDILQVEKRIRGRVKRQMEKSQREYYLNEQVKAIQKELGDMEEGADLDELEKRVVEAKMSKEAQAKALSELKKLKSARDQRAAATGVLDKIQVLEPSLGFSSVASQRSSMIEFTVKNGSDLPLSQLFLRGVAVESTGDKILFADDINYKLSERLAPGESKTIRLPNMDPGKWNSLEVWGRNNLLFTVELVNAESQPGEKLAPAFSNKDAQRLTVLEKSKPLLEKMLAE